MKTTYYYTALTAKGESTQGTVAASSEGEAISMLRLDGLYPTNIKSSALPRKETTKPRSRRFTISIPFPIITLPKVSSRDWCMMTVGGMIVGAVYFLTSCA